MRRMRRVRVKCVSEARVESNSMGGRGQEVGCPMRVSQMTAPPDSNDEAGCGQEVGTPRGAFRMMAPPPGSCIRVDSSQEVDTPMGVSPMTASPGEERENKNQQEE